MAIESIPVTVTLPRIDIPLIDRSTGFVTEPWYRFLESMHSRTGGDADLVDGTKVAASVADDKAVDAKEDVASLRGNTVVAGNGLTGGGEIGQGVQIDALKNEGWTPSSGAGDKSTAYAQYVAATAAATYNQAAFQAVIDELAKLSARYVALEAALFANEALGE